MDKILIWVWILLGSVLVVENLVVNFSSYVLIWIMPTSTLALLSIVVWLMIGYGIRWLMTNKKEDDYDDGF